MGATGTRWGLGSALSAAILVAVFLALTSDPPLPESPPTPAAAPPARRIRYEPPATPRQPPAAEDARGPEEGGRPSAAPGIPGHGNAVAIRGTVRTKDGRPVRGVRIAVLAPEADWRLAEIAAVTDEEGAFLAYLRDGHRDRPVRVVAECADRGFVTRERIVGAHAGEVDIVVEEGRTITGRAVGPDGEALPRAAVHIVEDYRGDPDLRRPAEGRVRADEDGVFVDLGFPPGVYRIFLSGELDGHEFVAVKEGVLAGEEEVRLRFPGFGALSLAFEDGETGEAITASTVTLEYIWGHTGEEEHYAPLFHWNDVGEVAADHLPEGDYRVLVRKPGYVTFLSDLLRVEAGADLGLFRYRLVPR